MVWSQARREVESEIQLLKVSAHSDSFVSAHSDSFARREGAPPWLEQERWSARGRIWAWQDDRVGDDEATDPAASGRLVIRSGR